MLQNQLPRFLGTVSLTWVSSYFVPTVLQNNIGLDHNLSQLIGGAINCMFFVGSLVPTFFLDKFGRRKPMMIGSLGLAISMMLISILLSFKYKPEQYSEATGKSTASAAIAFFFTYMLIFGASANCIPWVYVPEILPLHARAKGTAIGISSNWLWVRHLWPEVVFGGSIGTDAIDRTLWW